TMSRGGNENGQVYFFDRRTGRATLLTDGKSRNLLDGVRPDGGQLVIGSNQRNGRDTDLYLADPRPPGTMSVRLQVENEHWSVSDWSRDGKTLRMNRYVSINGTYPSLFDGATRVKTAIPIPGGVTAAHGAMKFAPDGKTAYVASDARGEFH